jgi:hypothetical protein
MDGHPRPPASIGSSTIVEHGQPSARDGLEAAPQGRADLRGVLHPLAVAVEHPCDRAIVRARRDRRPDEAPLPHCPAVRVVAWNPGLLRVVARIVEDHDQQREPVLLARPEHCPHGVVVEGAIPDQGDHRAIGLRRLDAQRGAQSGPQTPEARLEEASRRQRVQVPEDVEPVGDRQPGPPRSTRRAASSRRPPAGSSTSRRPTRSSTAPAGSAGRTGCGPGTASG